MKVRELIEQLQRQPQDAEVYRFNAHDDGGPEWCSSGKIVPVECVSQNETIRNDVRTLKIVVE
jgi:hypothetical protein